MDNDVEGTPSLPHFFEELVQLSVVGDVARLDEFCIHTFRQGSHSALQGVAQIVEGEFRSPFVEMPGNGPSQASFIRYAQDEGFFTGKRGQR
jgi:hypothetical protein